MPERARGIAHDGEAWTAQIHPVTTGLFFADTTPRHDAHAEGLFRRRPFAEWFGSGLKHRTIYDAIGAMHDATDTTKPDVGERGARR